MSDEPFTRELNWAPQWWACIPQDNDPPVYRTALPPTEVPEAPKDEGDTTEAWETVDYVLQDYLHNRLTPRVVDIAYSAFMLAKGRNQEDGGPTDWFTDTRPMVMKSIEKIRAAIPALRKP